MEEMTLAKWYGTSVSIPEFSSLRFVDFAVSCVGIVTSIVKEHFGKDIHVSFMNRGTAHADWDSMTISINQNYLKGEINPAIPRLTNDEALSLILGIEVHEAAHFAYSPPTGEEWVNYIKENTTCAFHPEVAMTVGNIIEDIYIEAEVDRELPSLTWMLNSLNNVFFSQYREDETMSNAAHIIAWPETLADVSLALNVLIFAKTRQEVNTTPYLQSLFELARSAVDTVYLSSRKQLSLAIYDALMERIEQSECENPSSGKELEESRKRSEGLTSPHAGKPEPFTGYGLAKVVNELLREMDEREISYSPPREDDFGQTSLYMEKRVRQGRSIEADRRYAALAEVARQRSSVNRPYGLDRSRGHSMRKLYRIATDSKIFAEPVRMSSYQPMDVVILLDCSGSMEHSGRDKISRLEKAAQATLGAASALVDARCNVAVYGHTADHITENEVEIYLLKEFAEPVSDLSSRLGFLIAEEHHGENRDGYAIPYVAKKFRSSMRRRLLIVISDGAPAANHYLDTPAILHTKQAVESVRQQGIDVLSISIALEARAVNDRIYGAQNNVFNEDPNIISEIVRSLLVN